MKKKLSKHTPESLIEEMGNEGIKLEGSLKETLGKDAIPFLQNTMESNILAHNEVPYPYTVVPSDEAHSCIIYNHVTGQKLKVGLCDLSGALAAINAFMTK